MQHIFGTVLRDNDVEIIDGESPGKGSYMGLQAAIADGLKAIRHNSNIKQLDIYKVIQGHRILTHQLFSENKSEVQSN